MHHINLTAIAQSAFKSLDLETCNIDDVREIVVFECDKVNFHDHDRIIDMVIEMIEANEE